MGKKDLDHEPQLGRIISWFAELLHAYWHEDSTASTGVHYEWFFGTQP